MQLSYSGNSSEIYLAKTLQAGSGNTVGVLIRIVVYIN